VTILVFASVQATSSPVDNATALQGAITSAFGTMLPFVFLIVTISFVVTVLGGTLFRGRMPRVIERSDEESVAVIWSETKGLLRQVQLVPGLIPPAWRRFAWYASAGLVALAAVAVSVVAGRIG
jgi:hypothetical protein